MQEKIEVGFQTFVSDGGEEFGAVREVAPRGRPELVVYVENAGDFTVALDAVESVQADHGDGRRGAFGKLYGFLKLGQGLGKSAQLGAGQFRA